MRAIKVSFTANAMGYSLMSLLGDRAAYHPVRLARSLAALRRSPFLTRAVRRRLAAYTQRGFHPDDTDNTALLQHWTAELFGDNGTLATTCAEHHDPHRIRCRRRGRQ